jgi:hypothetical protein
VSGVGVRDPLHAVAPSAVRLFGPAHRARLGIFALFLAVTGVTAGIAIGFEHPRANQNVLTATGRAAGVQTSFAAVSTSVTREQAVRQYGVLALAADASSTPRIVAAAEALQVTLTPLVARAPMDPVALDAARQLLTGERAILVVRVHGGDPQVAALLAQTEGLLAQLPTIPVVSPPAIVAAPTLAATPTTAVSTTPTPVTTPTQTPTATTTPTDPPTTDAPTPPSETATTAPQVGIATTAPATTGP